MISVNNVNFNYVSFEKAGGIWGSIKDMTHRKTVNVNALKSITLEIPDGSMVGIMGPNGAGKTTLIKLLTGILSPTIGFIEVNGMQPDNKQKQFLSSIGVLFGQKSQLSWDLPAIDTFNLLSHIYDLDTEKYKTRLAELVTMLDVTSFLNRPVRKLSLGQRMRCELIASLIHSPKYLFLDEPTLGLDITSQLAIYDFLKQENQKNHTTIIVTSHYLQDIQRISNRLLVLSNGEIAFDALTNELPFSITDDQFFTIDYIDDQNQQVSESVAINEAQARIETIGYSRLIGLTRQGMSFEEFILALYKR